MERILITGGTGFIGFHLADSLSESKGNHVIMFDNLSREEVDVDRDVRMLLQKDNVEFIEGDVTDRAALESLPSDISYIFHFAAVIGVENVRTRPDEVLRVNTQGTYQIAEFARTLDDLKCLLFASTSEVYAGTLKHFGMEIPTPETTPLALDDLKGKRTTYALSKMYGESTCHMFHERYGLPVSIVRYHNIYGPRMGFQHVMPEMFVKIRERDEIKVRSPHHTRAFCYVDDAVRATEDIVDEPTADNEVLNVGNSQEEIDILSLVELIVDVMDEDVRVAEGEADSGSPKRRCPDTNRLRDLVGYEPRFPLRQGLEETFDWYTERIEV